MKQYRRNQDGKTCKFCGATGLQWSEIAPGKHRLVEESGGVHDCREFHEAKHAGHSAAPDPGRGSLLRQMNGWTQRWYKTLPQDAAEELDDILDAAATSR